MRKTFVLMSLLSILLSACAQQTSAPALPTAAAPTAASMTEPVQAGPTKPPTTEPPTMEPSTQAAPGTAAPPASNAGSSSMSTYQLVPEESKVTYEVGETFFSQNNRFNLAVGVTPQVSGSVMLDPANPQSAEIGEIQVDISQFKSDSGRRDNLIRGRFLESSTYPVAVFKPTAIGGLPDSYTEGQDISFKVTGDLTVKQTTKPVTFDVTAKLENSTLTGTATTTILLSDFGVGPIELAGMLKTEDQAKLTLEFVAKPS
jgi:polyisoprenoid-binding protein YceI